jgi:hypothetical protein
VIGGIYPAYTQQFRVSPNEIQREEPFIQRNIEATARRVRHRRRRGRRPTGPRRTSRPRARGQVGASATPACSTPNRLAPTYEQLQRLTFYFGVATSSTSTATRSTASCRTSSSPRARSTSTTSPTPSAAGSTSARPTPTATGSSRRGPTRSTTEGRPVFVDTSAADSPIALDQPRVYFGELSPEYSIVNTNQPEIDGPQGLTPGQGGEQVEGQATFNYDGEGGVQLTHFGRKLAFALKYREPNLVLSDAIRNDSRLMFDREPRDRVRKVAPFLELDADPYPAAVDGRIVWIVDGYTTSAGYPYSQRVNFGDATIDSQSGGVGVQPQVNYIRNSVKATVDAYDGTVTLLPVRRAATRSSRAGTRPSAATCPARERDQRRAARAPALPRGPVQGPARAADAVPRHRGRRVLQPRGLLGHPGRPGRGRQPAWPVASPPHRRSSRPGRQQQQVIDTAAGRAEPAALLLDAAVPGPARTGLPALDLAHRPQPAQPRSRSRP